ncbi:BLUF domain-containing protein [Pelagicoccus sp. SDUM812003]|uniref:BLUF domain-containing protein n=1 Tax=Pelagicoccus sp. SDUM812003 TaxID=3041267 RepID=UPI00280CD761|nr:BLUF domain-containing protein [Pelagicoccus sp. SDUM812003]MDQ8205114.1 BLUF domain-containing protein [Pelagicoccus sp. SDUM812003]
MTTCRLIYRSIANEDALDNEGLASLLDTCVDNNNRDGITGMLVLSGDQFLQVLEGPSDKVNQLYGKIVADDRHHDVTLVSYEQIANRYFEDWSMRLVDLFDLPMQQRTFLMQKYSFTDDVIQIPEQLNQVYSLLMDAKAFCVVEPWKKSEA